MRRTWTVWQISNSFKWTFTWDQGGCLPEDSRVPCFWCLWLCCLQASNLLISNVCKSILPSWRGIPKKFRNSSCVKWLYLRRFLW